MNWEMQAKEFASKTLQQLSLLLDRANAFLNTSLRWMKPWLHSDCSQFERTETKYRWLDQLIDRLNHPTISILWNVKNKNRGSREAVKYSWFDPNNRIPPMSSADTDRLDVIGTDSKQQKNEDDSTFQLAAKIAGKYIVDPSPTIVTHTMTGQTEEPFGASPQISDNGWPSPLNELGMAIRAYQKGLMQNPVDRQIINTERPPDVTYIPSNLSGPPDDDDKLPFRGKVSQSHIENLHEAGQVVKPFLKKYVSKYVLHENDGQGIFEQQASELPPINEKTSALPRQNILGRPKVYLYEKQLVKKFDSKYVFHENDGQREFDQEASELPPVAVKASGLRRQNTFKESNDDLYGNLPSSPFDTIPVTGQDNHCLKFIPVSAQVLSSAAQALNITDTSTIGNFSSPTSSISPASFNGPVHLAMAPVGRPQPAGTDIARSLIEVTTETTGEPAEASRSEYEPAALAEEVYSILRRRLLIEKERTCGRL